MSTVLTRLGGHSMEHHAPHPTSKFEGFYSKFDLPSGAHLALIICSVPNASKYPEHMVSFTYYPKSGSRIFQREHFIKAIHRVTTGSKNDFEVRAEGIGFMRCEADSKTTWELETEDWSFKATTSNRTPWSASVDTPESWLVRLPLPLHWHVHSLSSSCNMELSIPSLDVPAADQKGLAYVHQEKNWANSFPSSHMWIQASNPSTETSICLAGGKILGLTAYLIGYRSPEVSLDFRPPFALAIFNNLSPFMTVGIDWENRTFHVTVSGFWKKLVLRAKAPKESGWFGLASPFVDGHRPNFCTESFLATIDVEVFERGWWGSWREVRRERFENGSLEFGGEYYPERGEKTQ
jgi:tocopherol cyclase